MNEVIEIKVYGTKSSNQQMVVNELKSVLIKAQIPFVLTEETDVTAFIKKGIESVPAIQYDDHEIIPLRSNGNFKHSLRKSISSLLDSKQFGHLNKMIVPIDFSNTSRNALRYAYHLAEKIDKVVKALHVYHPSSQDMRDAVYIHTDFSSMKKKYLEEWVQSAQSSWQHDQNESVYMVPEFSVGFPTDKILDSAKENKAELIVMGTTGDSNRMKRWFGSVSSNVLNESPVPVLFIPPNASYSGINKIIYAYDSYNIDKSCIDALLQFATSFLPEIQFLHVSKTGNDNPGYYITDLIGDRYPIDKFQTIQIKSSNISETLINYALDQQADLMVFGTESKTMLQKIMIHSHTIDMKHTTEIPLLVLKPTNRTEDS